MRPEPALLLAFVLILGTPGTGAEAPPEPEAKDPDAAIVGGKRKFPGLRLELIAPKTRYELGEPIEVTMRYTYTGDRKLAIEHVSYDRCGRISEFGFTAVDEKGNAVRDPIREHLGGIGGGKRGSGPLAPQAPHEQKVVINEWLCFDTPGRYTIRAHSRIVRFDPVGTGRVVAGPPIPLGSEPLALQITPPVEAHRLARLAKAGAAMRSEKHEVRTEAMRDLRFMVDERAIPLLLRGAIDRGPNVATQARFGLYSFRDLAPVKAEILKTVNDETRLIRPWDLIFYIQLLTEADLRAMGDRRGRLSKRYSEIYRGWRKRLTEKLWTDEKLARLPPVEAAQMTVEMLFLIDRESLDEPTHWKRIIENAAAMTRNHQAHAARLLKQHCRIKSLIPELKKLAADERVEGPLRTAAVVALHEMGDDSLRALLVEDITSPKPRFRPEAFATLKDYKAREIGEKLLRLLDSPEYGVRSGAAVRLRDFGQAVPLDELRWAVDAYLDGESYFAGTLLEALALKSPETALPFFREIVRGPQFARHRTHGHTSVKTLARLRLPEAQELILEMLHSPEYTDRAAMAWALGESGRMALMNKEDEGTGFARKGPPGEVPPSFTVPAAFIPELLMLYQADPSVKVRLAARNALAEMTRIPEVGMIWRGTTEQEKAWAAQWKAWWERNGARFGRWSRPWAGLVVKCTTDKGEYQIAEPVRLTIRVRRRSGVAKLLPRLRLRGQFLSADEPLEARGEWFQVDSLRLQREDKEAPIPALDPGSEIAFELDIHPDIERARRKCLETAERPRALPRKGRAAPPPGLADAAKRLKPPFRMRFYVEYIEAPEVGFWGVGALQSPPITIYFRKSEKH